MHFFSILNHWPRTLSHRKNSDPIFPDWNVWSTYALAQRLCIGSPDRPHWFFLVQHARFKLLALPAATCPVGPLSLCFFLWKFLTGKNVLCAVLLHLDEVVATCSFHLEVSSDSFMTIANGVLLSDEMLRPVLLRYVCSCAKWKLSWGVLRIVTHFVMNVCWGGGPHVLQFAMDVVYFLGWCSHIAWIVDFSRHLGDE